MKDHEEDATQRRNDEETRTPAAPRPEGDRSARPHVVRLERRTREELQRMIRWAVDFHRPKIDRG